MQNSEEKQRQSAGEEIASSPWIFAMINDQLMDCKDHTVSWTVNGWGKYPKPSVFNAVKDLSNDRYH